MQDWGLDRVYIWIRAANIYEKNDGVKFLIDQNDKSLFNLILKGNKWKCVLNQEISVRYSKEQIKILENKIEHIKNVKLELEQKKKDKTEFDWMEYEKMIYGNPAGFGIELFNIISKNVSLDYKIV